MITIIASRKRIFVPESPTQHTNNLFERAKHTHCSLGLIRLRREAGTWNHSYRPLFHLLSARRRNMRAMIIGLSTLALVAIPTLAVADGGGALTGAAGGAVAGAVVGGPVGAAVGGVAGGVIGGAASGPAPVVVAPGPGGPCNTRTTTTQNNNTGASVTRQTTDCQD